MHWLNHLGWLLAVGWFTLPILVNLAERKKGRAGERSDAADLEKLSGGNSAGRNEL